jgi:ribosomal protein L37AE/L43A
MQRGFKFGKSIEGLLLNRQELETYTEEQLLTTITIVQVEVSPCCQTRSFVTRKTRALPYRCQRCRTEFATVSQAPYYREQKTLDPRVAAARYRLSLLAKVEKKLDTLNWQAFFAAIDANSEANPSSPTAPLTKPGKNKQAKA